MRVWQVDLSFFFLFLINFFSQIHHLILGWLRIRLHDFFPFVFYKVILISWRKLQVWPVNSSRLELFLYHFFNQIFFLILYFQHWIDWELSFIIYFNLLFIGLFDHIIRVTGLTGKPGLTRVIFLFFYFNLFFLISSFNIDLIEN